MRRFALALMVALGWVAFSCGGKVNAVGELMSLPGAGSPGDASVEAAGGAAGSGGLAGSGGEPIVGGSPGWGGSGGFAGSTDPCAIPILEAGPAWIESAPGTQNEMQPVLVAIDAETAAVVYRYYSGDELGPSGVRFVPFQAWGPWSSDSLGPNVGPEVVGHTVRHQSTAEQDGSLQTLTTWGPYADVVSKGYSLRLGSSAPPYMAWSWQVTISPPAGVDYEPLFLSNANGKSLLGYSVGNVQDLASVKRLRGGTFSPGGGYVATLDELACATGVGVHADAIPVGNDFMVAYSTGRECCLCDDGEDGPPKMVVVRPPAASSLPPVVFKETTSVGPVRLLPRPDGAWLAFQDSKLRFARLGPLGEVIQGPVAFPSKVNLNKAGLGVMGEAVALAWVMDEELHVAHITTDLQVAGSVVTLPHPTSAYQLTPGISLLAHPQGDLLLVALTWPHPKFSRIQLLRFKLGCPEKQ